MLRRELGVGVAVRADERAIAVALEGRERRAPGVVLPVQRRLDRRQRVLPAERLAPLGGVRHPLCREVVDPRREHVALIGLACIRFRGRDRGDHEHRRRRRGGGGRHGRRGHDLGGDDRGLRGLRGRRDEFRSLGAVHPEQDESCGDDDRRAAQWCRRACPSAAAGTHCARWCAPGAPGSAGAYGPANRREPARMEGARPILVGNVEERPAFGPGED